MFSNAGGRQFNADSINELYRNLSTVKGSLSSVMKNTMSTGSLNTKEMLSAFKQVADYKKQIVDLSRQDLYANTQSIQEANKMVASQKQVFDMQQKLQSFKTSNTKMQGTDGYSQISSMLNELKTGVPVSVGRLNEMNTALNQVRQSALAAGKTGNSLGATFASALGKFGTWALVTNVLMTGSRAIRELVTNVKDLDAAMTELRKVTNETESTYTTFFDTAADRARDVGATMTDTIQATADFSRLGYNVDDASKLADAALVYKNVGDDISDISTASESITSTMQAFGVEADDVMSIVDKFNEVGNNFAISSDGIGEALKRSAAALAEGGNTLDESIALITATNEVVQNPESVGRHTCPTAW